MRRTTLYAMAVFTLLVVVPSGAQAAAVSFDNGGGDNLWNTAANWSNNQVPTSSDDVTISSFAVTVSGAAASAHSLTMSGCSCSTLTVTGLGEQLTIGAGTSSLTGNPSIDVTNGAAFNLNGPMTYPNSGSGHFNLGGGVNNAGTFHVGAAGSLSLSGGRDITDVGGGVVTNSGQITLDASSIMPALDNDGTVEVTAGTARLANSTGTSSGTFKATAPGKIRFTNASFQVAGSGSKITGTGVVEYSTEGGAATMTVGSGTTYDPAVTQFSGGTLNLNVDGSTGALTGGEGHRQGTGTLTVSGGATPSKLGDNTGSIVFTGANTTTINGTVTSTGSPMIRDGATLNLAGTTTVSGEFNVGDDFSLIPGGTVNNSGTFNITNDLLVRGYDPGVFNNTGTINRIAPNGNAWFLGKTVNTGTISVESGSIQTSPTHGFSQPSGTIDVKSGASIQGSLSLEGGVLKGQGTITEDLNNTGATVKPGASPGKLTVNGNYTQGAGGTLETEIQGTTTDTQYDHLAVGGNASLAGTLAIVNGGGFDPALTDTFDILTATGTVSGTFATVTGAALSGKGYSPQYTAGPPGKVRLTVVQGPQNQSAPSIPTSAQDGDAIACTPGTWTGSPTFAYEWLRDGTTTGVTTATYNVGAADVGHVLKCRVTATSSGISSTADSNQVTPTAKASEPTPAPVNQTAPSIPTSATEGDALSCSTGTWSGSPSFAYQWLRDGTAIATSQQYTVMSADVGHSLTCRVTATNAGGSASANSNAVTPKAKQPPITEEPDAPTVKIARLKPKNGCVISRFKVRVTVTGDDVTSVVVRLDRKKIKTTISKRFKVSIAKKKLALGRHKLKVVATNSGGTGTAKLKFKRCTAV